MTLSFLRPFCFVLSILGPLLSTDTLTFSDDHDSRLVEQTYIYDGHCQLKETLDSSIAVSAKKLPANCGPIDRSVCDTTTAPESPMNSSVKRERSLRRSGTEGEDQVIRELEARRETVLGREVTLQTPAGRTRIVVRNAKGDIEIVEVKNGPAATLTPHQQAAFRLIQQSGAKPHGLHASRAGLPVGGQMGPTPVRVIYVVACP